MDFPITAYLVQSSDYGTDLWIWEIQIVSECIRKCPSWKHTPCWNFKKVKVFWANCDNARQSAENKHPKEPELLRMSKEQIDLNLNDAHVRLNVKRKKQIEYHLNSIQSCNSSIKIYEQRILEYSESIEYCKKRLDYMQREILPGEVPKIG